MPAPQTTLRATVEASATLGAPFSVLIDGADTPVTVNGLAGYTPTVGDRLLVKKVGGTMEVSLLVDTLSGADGLVITGSVFQTDLPGSPRIEISSDPGVRASQIGTISFLLAPQDGSWSQAQITGEYDGPVPGPESGTLRIWGAAPIAAFPAVIVLGYNNVAHQASASVNGDAIVLTSTGDIDLTAGSGGVAGDLNIFATHGSILITGNTLITGNLTGSKVFAAIPDATTGSANVIWVAGGQYKTTSSLSRLKLQQAPVTLEEARSLLTLTPRTWFDKGEVEENKGSTEGLRRIPGLIAEDVAENVPEHLGLATYDAEGDLQGIAYDRVAALLLPIIAEQQRRIEALEAKVAALSA